MLYIIELLATIAALFISQAINVQTAFYALLGVNIWLMPLVVLTYISLASKKAGISTNEIEVSDVKQVKKKIVIRGILSSIGWGLFLWLGMAFFDTWQDPQISFWSNLMETRGFVIAFVISLIIATIFGKFSKIKTFKDE